MWWFIHAAFPSEFLSLIRIFYLWLQIMSMIKNSRVLRFLSPECGPAGLEKLHNTLQFTHHFWNSHFWGLFKLSLVKIKMRIYSEDLPVRNSRWLFSVIVIGRGNFEKKITQITISLMVIPIRSRSPKITKNHDSQSNDCRSSIPCHASLLRVNHHPIIRKNFEAETKYG